MSLFSGLLAMLGSLESDAIAVHEERCISLRNRNVSCQRCADACTSGVISRDDGKLRVEPERCIGCGTCATACPTCAIETRNPSDADLFQQLREVVVATHGHPVIACEQLLAANETRAKKPGRLKKRVAKSPASYDASRVVELPCLGRVDETVLVGLAAHGTTSITLACADCASCEHAPGGAMIRLVMESARNLLGAFGSSTRMELVSELPAHVLGASHGTARETGSSRRDFFQSIRDGSLGLAMSAAGLAEDAKGAGPPKNAKDAEGASPTGERAGATPPKDGHAGATPPLPVELRVGANGTLPQFIPQRRVRVFNYLRHLGEPVVETVESRIVGVVSIDTEECDSCRMCAVFCPTGALLKLDEGGRKDLIHRPSACVQCRLCESLCPKSAISVGSSVPIEQFLGGKAICYGMKQPAWAPNRPDSLFQKMRLVLGEDTEMCMF